ncbi:MAG: hypothetical protein AAFU71_12550 [Cyanobacteria bacterium J06632_22]
MSTSESASVSTPALSTTAAIKRRGQLVSNHGGPRAMVNVRRTAEIPTDGSNNIIHRRISGTEVFITSEKPADAQGFRWFLVYEKTAGDLGWVRSDVLLAHSPSPAPAPAPSPAPVPDPTAETQLLFETDSYVVRVSRGQTRLFMNVYHKATSKNELLEAATIQLPQLESASDWQTYLTQHNSQVYMARFVPLANTELVISNGSTGAVLLSQAGFRAEGVAFLG